FKHVTALDNDEASEERARDITDVNFSFVRSTFEDFVYPSNEYDLVNGQFAFSYIHKEKFQEIFAKVLNALKSGGIITGNIFGDRDEWNTLDSDKTFLNKEQFDKLFSNLSILKFDEDEK